MSLLSDFEQKTTSNAPVQATDGADLNTFNSNGTFYFNANSSANSPASVGDVTLRVVVTKNIVQTMISETHNWTLQRVFDTASSTWSAWVMRPTTSNIPSFVKPQPPIGAFEYLGTTPSPFTGIKTNYGTMSVVWNKRIYLFGGVNTANFSVGSLGAWNFNTNKWEAATACPPIRAGAITIDQQGTIEALGVSSGTAGSFPGGFKGLLGSALTATSTAFFVSGGITAATPSKQYASFHGWYDAATNTRYYVGGINAGTSNYLGLVTSDSNGVTAAVTGDVNRPNIDWVAFGNATQTATHGYLVYGVGFSGGTTPYSTIYSFEFSTKIWKLIIPANQGPAAGLYSECVHGNSIYMFGLYTGVITSSFWEYNIVTNSFTDLTSLITPSLLANAKFPNHMPIMASDGTSIHFFGGPKFTEGTSTSITPATDAHWIFTPGGVAHGSAQPVTPTTIAGTVWNKAFYLSTTNSVVVVPNTGVSQYYDITNDSWMSGQTPLVPTRFNTHPYNDMTFDAALGQFFGYNGGNVYAFSSSDLINPLYSFAVPTTTVGYSLVVNGNYVYLFYSTVADQGYMRYNISSGTVVLDTAYTAVSYPVRSSWSVTPVFVSVGTNIYSFAGHNGVTDTNDMTVLDTVTNTWRTVPVLSKPPIGSYSQMVHLNGVLYITGLRTNGTSSGTSEFWKFDIAAETWTNLSGLITSNSGVLLTACLASDGQNVYLGLGTNSTSFFKYIP